MCTHNSTRHATCVTATIVGGMVLLTLTLFAPAAVAQSPVFMANGAFASAFNCSSSNSTVECVEVFVSRSSSPSGGITGTFLNYDHFVVDLNTGVVRDAFGFGTIPDSAFHVKGKFASVNVNTNLTGFVNVVCTFDPSTNTGSCDSSAPGGDVTGSWTEFTPHVGFRFSGTSKFSSPSVTFISTGTSDRNAAITNVSVLGAVATNITGFVGTQHNTSISVEHR